MHWAGILAKNLAGPFPSRCRERRWPSRPRPQALQGPRHELIWLGCLLLYEKMSAPGERKSAPAEGPFPLQPLLPLLLLQGPLPSVAIPILQSDPVCEIYTPCQSSSRPVLTGFLMQSRVPPPPHHPMGCSHRPSQARREATIRGTRVCPKLIFTWLLERNPRGLRDPSEGSDLDA